MGRHSSPKVPQKGSFSKSREASLNKLYELEDQAHEHLKQSLGATRLCTALHVDKNGKEIPCLICKGEFVVPDVARRNWAFEEINTRISPKPKAVEITSEDNTQESDEQEMSKKSNKDLEALVKGYSSIS